MTEPTAVPYRVTYSERIRQRVLTLAKIAFERGGGEASLVAATKSHRQLTIYPRSGG